MARDVDFARHGTGLWTRVNALNSPWLLDDLLEIVAEVGNKLDVVMVPKVEGPWDIHYVDQLLAQLEARAGVTKPILIHASWRRRRAWPTSTPSPAPRRGCTG